MVGEARQSPEVSFVEETEPEVWGHLRGKARSTECWGAGSCRQNWESPQRSQQA